MPKAKPTPTPARKKPAPPVDLNEVAKLLAENAKAIVELRKLNAETNAKADKRAAANAKAIAELRKSIAETNAEAAKRAAENSKAIAELRESAAEALAVAKENNRYIGTHANGEGEILEIECYDALLKMGELNGVKLERLRLGMNDPQYGVEIDLVGVNGKFTFPMEVKRTLLPEDVRRFEEVQVERFKQAYPEYVLGKQVTPVVIFALRKKVKNPADGKKEDPVQLALEAGMIVLQSTGKNQLSPITAASAVVKRPDKDD